MCLIISFFFLLKISIEDVLIDIGNILKFGSHQYILKDKKKTIKISIIVEALLKEQEYDCCECIRI